MVNFPEEFETSRLYIVGSSGLHRINWEARRFEIGYGIRTSETHKGYMTEAVNGIVRFAADNLEARRVEIRCDLRNARSRQVAVRAGFHREATLRNGPLDVNGRLSDTAIYAILRLADDSWGCPPAFQVGVA